MPPRGMYDAIPGKHELGGKKGADLYECALCTCLHPPNGLFWTFWRQPQGWILWPFIRRPHDPCYGYACKACQKFDSRVDADFVPATPLVKVVNKIAEDNERDNRFLARYGRLPPHYECFTCQEAGGTWMGAMGEFSKMKEWSDQGGSGSWSVIISEKENFDRGPVEVVLRGYATQDEAELALIAWKPDWQREVDERKGNPE